MEAYVTKECNMQSLEEKPVREEKPIKGKPYIPVEWIGKWCVYAAGLTIDEETTPESLAQQLYQAADDIVMYGNEWDDWKIDCSSRYGAMTCMFIGRKDISSEEFEDLEKQGKKDRILSIKAKLSDLNEELDWLEGREE
jgi:hypothetical protein